MGSRFPSHQLSNGLYVSGRPEQPKEKAPVICSSAMPYTGGDIKKSGELGKMFDLHRKSGPLGNQPSRNTSFGGAASNSGPVSNAVGRSNYSGSISSAVPGTGGSSRTKSNSGPLNKHGEPTKRSSGPQSGGVTPMARQNSGPLPPVLPTTGLITSGPITSGQMNSSGAQRKVSGPLDSSVSMKMRTASFAHNPAVTNLNAEDGYSIKGSIPSAIMWLVALLFVVGFVAGGFILAAIHNPILLVVVVVIFGFVAALVTWNICWGTKGVTGFVSHYPDADLRTAKDGEYVKVTGVVTCGNLPLESSFQRVPRSMERHAVDFYISDFQSGLRALVKTGFGARVTPYVDESVVIDINPENKDMSPEFLRWLRGRNLSSDDRTMRLKEGYIKEGSTVSVMGVVQRNDNVLMIVAPAEPISTGCQWAKCMLPTSLDGLVLRCEDTSDMDVIPV